MCVRRILLYGLLTTVWPCPAVSASDGAEFFERRIRPVLVQRCFECHSENARSREGGLLLDRESGWLQGGDTGKAVVPGDPDASLLLKAVSGKDDDLRMPPDGQLEQQEIDLLTRWVAMGAPGPKVDPGATEFSRLGDQEFLFDAATRHWAFQPIVRPESPPPLRPWFAQTAVDHFIGRRLGEAGIDPSRRARDSVLARRLYFALTGLPPAMADVRQFEAAAQVDREQAVAELTDNLLNSQAYGQHVATMWLDVARYADTDSAYRPDTRTPHYFPFAFTYRDYVIDSFNQDKPFDQFIREQLAADLMGFDNDAPEIAALGFLATGPHANRNQFESIDDWIDLTTRGLMGMTAACARCHDHKYEPIPTSDYYALHGIFSSVKRISPLDERRLPRLTSYSVDPAAEADYKRKRAAIDRDINAAAGKKSGGNNRSVSQKIRETKLAELLLFHTGGPSHAMVVEETGRPVESFVAIRGDLSNRGDRIPRRFLSVLDSEQSPFPADNSGRLTLADRIVSPKNPLTTRVYVNRVWGMLMGSYLVSTPSDFGLQGAKPSHPELLDWLASEFIRHGWSTKSLIRTIVGSAAWQQRVENRAEAVVVDSENRLYWRTNRKHLSVEAIRDSMLAAAASLDRTHGGRAAELWGDGYTRRRAVYGYINRFNLDPTLRAWDFPARMQTTSGRGESIVAPQALFAMNSPFAIDQAVAVTELSEFRAAASDRDRVTAVFEAVLQRAPADNEIERVLRFVEQQNRLFDQPRRGSTVTTPWPLVAQALFMSNEFQYVD